MSDTDEEIMSAMSRLNIAGTVDRSADNIRYTHIFSSATEERPILLMIHGAPGSGQNFKEYWSDDDLREAYDIVAIDRPGYGHGDLAVYHTITSQASSIISLLDEIARGRKVAILTHSYGGPIGALVAQGLGDDCIGHVMVAPVIDPESERIFWFSGIPIIWPFKLIAAGSWKVAAMEKYHHGDELKDLDDQWGLIDSKTIHIHGLKDWIASVDNIPYLKEQMDPVIFESVILPGENHFILWDKEVMKTIKQSTVSLLQSSDMR